jgi:hypothetical protein
MDIPYLYYKKICLPEKKNMWRAPHRYGTPLGHWPQILPAPPRMAATLPSSAAASPLLLRRNTAASPYSRCRQRWQHPAATRRDGPGAPLPMRSARRLPPAAPSGCNGARGDTLTAAATATGEAPYSRSEGKGSLWMVLVATAVVVCGSFEFGTCVRTSNSGLFVPRSITSPGENFNLFNVV